MMFHVSNTPSVYEAWIIKSRQSSMYGGDLINEGMLARKKRGVGWERWFKGSLI